MLGLMTWIPNHSFFEMLWVNLLLLLTTFDKGLSTETALHDVVDTGYAKYHGNRSFPNTVAYLGIPYAEPPLGNFRFRAPLPLNTTRVAQESRGRIIDATEYPNFCVQGTTGRRVLAC